MRDAGPGGAQIQHHRPDGQDGGDPQLEKAVEVALEMLKTDGVDLLPQPPDPVRVKRPE